jgi:hypothetical protein
MLGLGNAINKARVYKTFVGPAATYEYISEGSVGESGYIISHAIYNASGNPVDPDSIVVGGEYYIRYTEVYPQPILYNDNSKATATQWASEIHNNLSFVGDLDNDEVLTSSDDWRIIHPRDFDDWKLYIYNSPEFEGLYHEGDSENPYICVTATYYNTWLDLGFPVPQEPSATQFIIKHTDDSPDYYVEYNDLFYTSYYTLAVRTFQPADQLQFFGQTPEPTSTVLPTEPEPALYVQRSSSNLTSNVTDNPPSDSIDLSINADEVTINGINMFFVDEPPSGLYADMFKVQFNIEFPVDQDTDTVYDLPDPWGPSNTEQKKLYVDYVILGWKDFPFVDLPLTSEGASEALLSGVPIPDIFEYSGKLLTAEVDLNKVTNDDMNNGFALPDGQGGTVDGYYVKNSDSNTYYGYTGYLDVQNDPAVHISSNLDDITIRQFAEGLGDDQAISNKKRYFIIRVLGVRFGTDERIPSSRSAFPQNLKYILMPIINPTQFLVFHSLVGSGGGIADDFIGWVFGGVGQDSPPPIDGQNEDYYN